MHYDNIYYNIRDEFFHFSSNRSRDDDDVCA